MTDQWPLAAAIAGATLVSEDLTCIAVGLLVVEGRLDPLLGVAACIAGIFVGDLGLWAGGRLLAERTVRLAVFRRRIGPGLERLRRFSEALDSRLALTVLTTRAVPGTRLIVYVAAGALGRRPLAFALWAFVSVALWVPAIVFGIVTFGDAFLEALTAWLGAAWLAVPAAAVTIFAAVRLLTTMGTVEGRARLWASISRIWRWEFWPSWLFYAPVLPWIAWLSVRHGGPGTLAAANPGMPEGGFVGESKFDILATLPDGVALPAVRLDPAPTTARLARLIEVVEREGWSFPVVLKPDAGQRGAAVRLVKDAQDATRYFERVPVPVIAQQYHPGPFEAGVFYYRYPGEARGRIFSITDKHFPMVIGDGRSSVAALVWAHPRYRMQARRFLERLGPLSDRVLPPGEALRLAFAGNHAQGTMFLDGSHLATPALERRIDEIARAIPGFFIGRFDVRYADVKAFTAGRDLAIVELNGATSESTNIYDPSRSLLAAYRTLFRQWRLVFQIGAANRRLGHAGVPASRLAWLAWTHVRGSAALISD
jgi:membrane protein DedA with SNARE-associated domain